MSKRFDFTIRTKQDLMDAVESFGFVPLFRNSIPGFSVEEHVAPEAWFSEEDGVWEWKGPVIRELGCAYGKLFERKAAFVSRAWFPELANYRRDGYDFDARFDDGLASYPDRTLFDLVNENAPLKMESGCATKIVPVVTIGSKGYIGAAQISGPKEQVDKCKAALTVEGQLASGAVRVQYLVPIDTNKPTSLDNVHRVQGVGVSARLDLGFPG